VTHAASITASFESRLEAVEQCEAMVRRFATECGFDEDDVYFLGLAAREIVINAIRHGNRFDPAKRVDVNLRWSEDKLIIEVSDSGEGFHLEDVPDPRSPENHGKRSGRGLAMTRGIMDEVSVGENTPAGTRVRMVKALPLTLQPEAGHARS
jgi:serine/threonine-protein kinase RsbW